MHMKSEGGEIGVYLCPENDEIEQHQQSHVKLEFDSHSYAAGSPSCSRFDSDSGKYTCLFFKN